MLTEIGLFDDYFQSWAGTCVIVYDFYLVQSRKLLVTIVFCFVGLAKSSTTETMIIVSKLNGLSKQFICFSFPGDFAREIALPSSKLSKE